MAGNDRLGHDPILNEWSVSENRCSMAKQTDSPTKDKAEEPVAANVDELSAEELDQISAAGKASSSASSHTYHNAGMGSSSNRT